MTQNLQALAYGVAVLAALELAIQLLRRFSRTLRVGLLFHVWAFLAAAAVALARLPVPELLLKNALGALAVATALVLFVFFDAGVVRRPWDPSRGPMMPKLVRDVVRILVVVAVVLLVAKTIFDVELSTVLVSSTVVSAVLGLALQDVLGQVFAGMALQIERPFAIGDWLMVDGQLGKVVEMSWRTTRLRTNEGVDLYEPNGTIASARLVNYGSGRQPVAFHFDFAVAYDAPPTRVKETLLAVARETPGVASEPPPEVFLTGYGESSMSYQLRCWTHEVARFNPLRDQVHSRVWYALRRAEIEFPYPVRTVYLHQAEEISSRAREGEVGRSADLLAHVDLFRGLPEAAQRRLAETARHQDYADGERLVRENESGDSLFVVARGKVVITKSGAELGTGTIELAKMGEGDFFGEMSLLTGEPRSATVTALGPCSVVVLSKAELAPVIASDPSLAESLAAALASRRAEAAATLQDRQDRRKAGDSLASHASLLHRIRAFFRLQHEA